MNADKPVLSGQKCRPVTLVYRNVSMYADIREGSSGGASNDSGIVDDGNL